MKIILTTHAVERMIARGACRAHKAQKLAEKAWRHKSDAKRLNRINYKCEKNYVAREILGFIYIFAVDRAKDEAVLTTVYKV